MMCPQRPQQLFTWMLGILFVTALAMPLDAVAYTLRRKATGTPLGADGVVIPTAVWDYEIVEQGITPDAVNKLCGQNPPVAKGVLCFIDDGQNVGAFDFRDSNESIKLTFDINAAGARIIIYTDNGNPALANPRYCGNPALGIDGGGLVGVADCSSVVPMVWTVYDDNVNHVFATPVGDNEAFITDLAHVRTLADDTKPMLATNGPIDNIPMKFCDPAATNAVPPDNQPGDGLYPQYFGAEGVSLDLCSAQDYGFVFPPGGGTVFWTAGAPIAQAQELVKNIAVVAFNLFHTKARVPNLATITSTDSLEVTSPIYLPIAADFQRALAQPYQQTTLTIDVVQQ